MARVRRDRRHGELRQGPTIVHGTVHGPGYAGAAGITGTHRAAASLADDFHVYSVSWEPERIRWYLDDELYRT